MILRGRNKDREQNVHNVLRGHDFLRHNYYRLGVEVGFGGKLCLSPSLSLICCEGSLLQLCAQNGRLIYGQAVDTHQVVL